MVGEKMRFSDICNKQVINIADGSLVGFVVDLGFDPCTYEIHSLFVQPLQPFVKKMLPWFFKCEQIHIMVKEIENIEGDVILVRFS